MAKRYVAAVDQGTASSRCLVFDAAARIVAVAQKEHRQIFPRAGWVEHDPYEIWTNVQEVVAGALDEAGLGVADLAALGRIASAPAAGCRWRRTSRRRRSAGCSTTGPSSRRVPRRARSCSGRWT